MHSPDWKNVVEFVRLTNAAETNYVAVTVTGVAIRRKIGYYDGALTTTWAPFSFRGLGLIRGDIMYNSKTKATMKAATTRSIINGKIGHQELMKIQSVTVELQPASVDMGEARRPLACLLTSGPDRADNKVTTLAAALGGSGRAQPSEEELFRIRQCVKVTSKLRTTVDFGIP